MKNNGMGVPHRQVGRGAYHPLITKAETILNRSLLSDGNLPAAIFRQTSEVCRKMAAVDEHSLTTGR